MKGLFGIGNTNVLNTLNIIKEIDSSLKVQVLGADDTVKSRADAILVPSVALFLKRRLPLQESSSSVFVFDTPVLLTSIKYLELLDARSSKNFTFKLYEVSSEQIKEALNKRLKVKLKSQKLNIIPVLLNETTPSIMKPIQTFLYSIVNTQERAAYNKELFKYFTCKNTDLKALQSSLISLSKQKKSGKALERLLSFLEEDDVKNVKCVVLKALKHNSHGDKPEIDKMATEYGVSAYDVRYLINAAKSHVKVLVD